MRIIDAAEFSVSALLAEVASGGSVTLAVGGRPVARLAALDGAERVRSAPRSIGCSLPGWEGFTARRGLLALEQPVVGVDDRAD